MTDIYDKEAVRARFLEIAASKTNLKDLSESQIVESINIFQNLAFEAYLYENSRSSGEAYINTAIDRDSILAGASDRNYTPNRPKPTTGNIKVVNDSASDTSLAAGTVIMSDDEVIYEVVTPVIALAGTTATTDVIQYSREVISHTVNAPIPFYEITLESTEGRKVSEIEITVDGDTWTEEKLFHNTNGESEAWVTFYTEMDELGIRFGNGIFGKLIPQDAVVEISLKNTEGSTLLTSNQTLHHVDESLQLAQVEILSDGTISTGSDFEDIESVRRNSLYYFLYDEQHVWADDYSFYLRQKYPEILFLSVWGEQEQEIMDGALSEDNRNKIFFSVYAKDTATMPALCLTELEKLPEWNREFQHTDYVDKKFTIDITMTIQPSLQVALVQQSILDQILIDYSKDSTERKPLVIEHDIHKIIRTLDVSLDLGDVTIVLGGDTAPDKRYDLVSVDESAITINLSY